MIDSRLGIEHKQFWDAYSDCKQNMITSAMLWHQSVNWRPCRWFNLLTLLLYRTQLFTLCHITLKVLVFNMWSKILKNTTQPMSSYSLISSNCSYLDVLISIFQCPNHLFSQYVRFLVALGSLYIIPHFTLKIENFNLVTLSMLTFLSSCTRLGCHNISSWE